MRIFAVSVGLLLCFALGWLMKSSNDIEELERKNLCATAALVKLGNLQAKELIGSPSNPVPYVMPEECQS